jgi:hypothetical protein
MISFRATHVALAVALSMGLAHAYEGREPSELRGDAVATIAVAGSGEDQLSTAVVHAQETTPTGKIQKSTEVVVLSGDLKGFVLYHVTSVFDFAAGTLVNTGDQVFSGTVVGSAPVMIHDDQFRFRVNLATGEESGKVYLFDHVAGPKVRCQLVVVGTGLTAEGNPTFDYHGTCTFRGPRNR